MYSLAIFDLDGTLLDTLGDLYSAVNFALRRFGFPERTIDEVRSFIGNGVVKLMERSTPDGIDSDTQQRCLDAFRKYYLQHMSDTTAPYANVRELLLELRKKGVKIAVVSNKADFAVKTLMEDYFKGLYDCAYGERTGVERKPAPDGVFGAISEMGGEIENTVYIGDSEVDVETSKNAKLPCIAVTWGFRDKEVLESLNPEYIVDSPSDILRIIERGI